MVFQRAKILDENSDILKKTQKRKKRYKKPGDFNPVSRNNPFGGPFLLETTVKQVIFERAKIRYKTSDMFIVFGERQKRYKMHEILGDFYPLYREGPFWVLFCSKLQ